MVIELIIIFISGILIGFVTNSCLAYKNYKKGWKNGQEKLKTKIAIIMRNTHDSNFKYNNICDKLSQLIKE